MPESKQLHAREPIAPPLERAIVARGRTVVIPDPDADRSKWIFTGREPESHRELFAPPTRDIGPGGEVELPRDEVRHLRGLGFLTDPDAAEFRTEDGQSHGVA